MLDARSTSSRHVEYGVYQVVTQRPFNAMYGARHGRRAGSTEARRSSIPVSPRVLVVDVGGTHAKILAAGTKDDRRFDSGPSMTPDEMVRRVRNESQDWSFDVVAMGYPGPVTDNRPAAEPHNLARGWVGFDFDAAFGRPVRIINDAAMQRWQL